MIPNPLRDLDYESARDATPVWYGVSSGNGNDGVSQMYPDYYVRTADPYRLAELAMLDKFKAESMDWAKDSTEVDGERDYTITATIYEDPDGCPAYGGGAWLIMEVFPADLDDVATWQTDPWKQASCYDRLESAFSVEALALVPCG